MQMMIIGARQQQCYSPTQGVDTETKEDKREWKASLLTETLVHSFKAFVPHF